MSTPGIGPLFYTFNTLNTEIGTVAQSVCVDYFDFGAKV